MGGEKDSPEWDFCRKHQRERDKGERKHKGEEMRKG
jgi:hypothetical protein